LPEAGAPTSARVRTASISAARPFDRLGMDISLRAPPGGQFRVRDCPARRKAGET
jgi:hypothetical protein